VLSWGTFQAKSLSQHPNYTISAFSNAQNYRNRHQFLDDIRSTANAPFVPRFVCAGDLMNQLTSNDASMQA